LNIYFFDTSALVKRYVDENGSNWVKDTTSEEKNNPIILSHITWVEVLSAFTRLNREKKLSESDMDESIEIFQYDWNFQYNSIEVDDYIIQSSGDLVRKYPLRAYDSIQLASALKLNSIFLITTPSAYQFVSADKRLINVAQNEGLETINPNEYE